MLTMFFFLIALAFFVWRLQHLVTRDMELVTNIMIGMAGGSAWASAQYDDPLYWMVVGLCVVMWSLHLGLGLAAKKKKGTQ